MTLVRLAFVVCIMHGCAEAATRSSSAEHAAQWTLPSITNTTRRGHPMSLLQCVRTARFRSSATAHTHGATAAHMSLRKLFQKTLHRG